MKDSAFTNRPLLFLSTLEKARDCIIFPKRCVQPASFVPPFRLFESLSSREAETQRIQEPAPRPSPRAPENTAPSGCVSEASFLVWGDAVPRSTAESACQGSKSFLAFTLRN